LKQVTGFIRSDRIRLIVCLAALSGGFAVDVSTPRGFSDWVLYLLVLIVAMRVVRKRELVFLAVVASGLTFLGFLLSPTGQPIWLSALARSLALMLIWTTVTVALKWRRADEKLRRLDQAVEGSGEIVFMVDTEGVITFINPAFTETYGYSAEEVVGKTTPRILKSGQAAAETYQTFWSVLRSKRRYQGEFINKTKDGRLLTVEASASAILNSRGQITGFLGIQRDVTEWKRADEALRKSEASLSAAQRIAHIGNWDWDIVNDRAWWSGEMYRIFGVDPKGPMPSIGESLKLMHPDDRASVEVALNVALHEGKPYATQYRIVRPDGVERTVHAQGEVERDASGKPTRMVGIVQDITERTRAEERMRILEHRFFLAFNAAPEPMTISRLSNSTYVDVNNAFLQTTGYERKEVIGRSSLALKFWAAPEQRQALLEQLRKGPVRDFEIVFVTKQGAQRWGHLSAEAIDVDGERCLLAVTKDVTERKRAEEELRRLNRALRTISECNQALVRASDESELLKLICEILVDHGGFRMAWVGYVEHDEAKRVRPVAHAGEELGYLSTLNVTWADEPLGRGPTGTAIRTERPSIARNIGGDATFAPWREEALRRGYASSIGLPLIADAKLGALSLYSSEVDAFDPDEVELLSELANDLAYGVTALRNRSERERAENVLKKTQEQFLQAQKMEAVGRLAGGVAHDFNNLLTVINGYSDLLLSQSPEGSVERGQLEEIKKAGDRAAALTRQLLAFSRKQVVMPTVLNLNLIVEGMERMLHRVMGEDIQLVVNLSSSLGRVRADAGQIEQIIMNLVVNARDAMPKGGRLSLETTNVELDDGYTRPYASLTPGHYVMLAISDTGCGMDAETQSHIFEPFFTTKGQGKGTGLGLSTAYGIVKQSGGIINVYSEVGRGTTFRVYLQRVDEPMPEGPKPEEKTAPAVGTETILLVEDEPAVRSLAHMALQSKGYSVLVAGEYIEAMTLARQHVGDIHLLLTDVIMPGLNGRELAHLLSALRPTMKVLFISGYTADAIAQHGILDEGVAFLPKPFTPRELLRKVRETLDGDKA
jgi:PAS domain S-box-containing protein